jgi:hypothetical protein
MQINYHKAMYYTYFLRFLQNMNFSKIDEDLIASKKTKSL